jgi:hypothetical protein
MKRVLLIGIVLAICILAMPQGVLATTLTGKNVNVDAKYAGADITCTPASTVGSGSSSTWVLTKANNPNLKTGGITVGLETTRSYTITAYDSKGLTNEGKMTATDGAGAHVLANAFQMQMGGTGGVLGAAADIIETTPGTPKLFVSGPPSKPTLSSSIWQNIADTDWSSATPYSITIVFTCSNDY